MSCDIFTDKFVSDVITGLQKCSDPLYVNCLECPWAHHPNGCRRTLEQGALIIIKHYRDENGCLETELKKRVDELRKAEMEVKYHMNRNEALDRTIKEQEENNARLTEQNKKLLEKEIENTRLRNKNQTIREDNKDLEERNDKLAAEIIRLNADLAKAGMDIEYQINRNKELENDLTRYTEEKQMLAKQPLVHFDEPMRIEPISTFGVDLKTARKVAKAANKAAIACERFNKALDELSIVATKF